MKNKKLLSNITGSSIIKSRKLFSILRFYSFGFKIHILIIAHLFVLSYSHAQNVGIGSTPHPSAKLEINANDAGVLIPKVNLTGANDAVTIPSPAMGLMLWNTASNWGTAGFYFNAGTTASPNWIRLATENDKDHDWYEQGTTTAPGNINDNIYTQGNVGIGTNSTTDRLDVNGTTRLRDDVLMEGGADALTFSSWASMGYTDGNGRFNIYENATNAGTEYLQSEQANRITMHTDGIKFYTAPSGTAGDPIAWDERLRIANNGYVGIGITGPSSQLHTSGGVRFETLAGGGDRYVKTDNNGLLSASATVPWVDISGAPTIKGNKWDGTDNTSGDIGRSGNVGIGTTAPADQLHVNGFIRLPGSEGNDYQIRAGQNVATGVVVRAISNPSNENPIFAVESSGGATRFGVTQGTGAWARDGFWSGTYDNGGLSQDVGMVHTGQSMRLLAGASERVRIMDNGNVGINTTNPQGRLHVVGDFYNQESAYGESTFLTGGLWLMRTVDIQTHGTGINNSVVLIHCEIDYYKTSSSTYVVFGLYRNGSQISEISEYSQVNVDKTIHLQWVDEPPAGNNKYEIYVYYPSGGMTYYGHGLNVTEIKR
ncbi:MAG: hypothetical protein WD048_07070 [Chitinophagales bacterium]